MECVEREYFADRRLAAQEFEEKKAELKENLLLELEDKKKIIEQERYSLELTGDSMEVLFLYIFSLSFLCNFKYVYKLGKYF